MAEQKRAAIGAGRDRGRTAHATADRWFARAFGRGRGAIAVARLNGADADLRRIERTGGIRRVQRSTGGGAGESGGTRAGRRGGGRDGVGRARRPRALFDGRDAVLIVDSRGWWLFIGDHGALLHHGYDGGQLRVGPRPAPARTALWVRSRWRVSAARKARFSRDPGGVAAGALHGHSGTSGGLDLAGRMLGDFAAPRFHDGAVSCATGPGQAVRWIITVHDEVRHPLPRRARDSMPRASAAGPDTGRRGVVASIALPSYCARGTSTTGHALQ